jgi:Asp-tRNA(Asn)/Glu-tRNA(Gln) amidotransferase C subunit
MSRSLTPQALAAAARFARLDLPEDRAELVRGTIESVHGLLDRLDELDLGETPPATAYNARWE